MVDTTNKTTERVIVPLTRKEHIALNSPETSMLTPNALHNKHNFVQNYPALNIVNHK